MPVFSACCGGGGGPGPGGGNTDSCAIACQPALIFEQTTSSDGSFVVSGTANFFTATASTAQVGIGVQLYRACGCGAVPANGSIPFQASIDIPDASGWQGVYDGVTTWQTKAASAECPPYDPDSATSSAWTRIITAGTDLFPFGAADAYLQAVRIPGETTTPDTTSIFTVDVSAFRNVVAPGVTTTDVALYTLADGVLTYDGGADSWLPQDIGLPDFRNRSIRIADNGTNETYINSQYPQLSYDVDPGLLQCGTNSFDVMVTTINMIGTWRRFGGGYTGQCLLCQNAQITQGPNYVGVG